MEQLKFRIATRKFKVQTVPIAFLILTIIGFGLLTPWLGYYQDDWPYVFYAFNKGITSLREELFFDSRPYAAWIYMIAFNLLGFKPFYWHATALIMRWITGTIFWNTFKKIWPIHIYEITFAILLFLIHPFFLIQPAAVNSILYWSGFMLFAFSTYLMIESYGGSRFWKLYRIASIIFSAVHLFSVEYFAGMELVRPLILYWIYSHPDRRVRNRIKSTFIGWAPYLVIFILFLTWRIFFFPSAPGGDRNSPVVIFKLLSDTLPTLIPLIRTAIQDTIIIGITSWFRTVQPESFSFTTLFDWFVVTVTLLVLVVCLYYFNRIKVHFDGVGKRDSRFEGQLFITGLAILILGILPAWLIGQDIVSHKNQFAASRFGIGSTLGAAILLAWLVIRLIGERRNQIIVVSILTALAINMHLYNSKGFQFSWEKQTRFYQQLIWRAPNVEEGTAFITDQDILPYMGQYAVSFGIITAYQPGNVNSPPYWYFPFYYTYPVLEELLTGIPISDGRVSMNFNGWSRNSLVFYFEPGLDQCLWILQPENSNLRLVSEDLRQLSAISAIDRITHLEGAEKELPKEIFPRSSEKGWCYFFEKGDLARQNGNWERAIELWEQAIKSGIQPGNGFEYLPFIEAYGRAGNWDQVRALTKNARKISQGLEPSLCSTLNKLEVETTASTERNQLLSELRTNLKCNDFQ